MCKIYRFTAFFLRLFIFRSYLVLRSVPPDRWTIHFSKYLSFFFFLFFSFFSRDTSNQQHAFIARYTCRGDYRVRIVNKVQKIVNKWTFVRAIRETALITKQPPHILVGIVAAIRVAFRCQFEDGSGSSLK